VTAGESSPARPFVVAIDGPAGAGKSTVARAVARRLGWRYMDTGAMYRAVALAAITAGIDPSDERGLEVLAASVDVADERVTLDGRDVTMEIRGEPVTEAVSAIAAHPGVREVLVDRQRALARTEPVVIEGRDIGTVVVPDAPVKIFLVASPTERALRRARQLGLATDDATIARIAVDLTNRDAADESRTVSPLAPARDAIVLDSTDRDVDDVVDAIVARIPGGARATTE
jgi:cytidylate kinase